ncbi:hypothetical protein MMC07_003748 [Pseudocyphellaria aurata]|nr:hypothetical protein [Pseudocyphellaria aurata]
MDSFTGISMVAPFSEHCELESVAAGFARTSDDEKISITRSDPPRYGRILKISLVIQASFIRGTHSEAAYELPPPGPRSSRTEAKALLKQQGRQKARLAAVKGPTIDSGHPVVIRLTEVKIEH